MKRCVLCKGDLMPALVEEAIRVDGVEFSAAVPVQGCSRCGETFVTAAALGDFEVSAAAFFLGTMPNSAGAARFAERALGADSQRGWPVNKKVPITDEA